MAMIPKTQLTRSYMLSSIYICHDLFILSYSVSCIGGVTTDNFAGKKKDMMSMFQSRTALEKQADKLSAKQEELNIKSTGKNYKNIL